MLQTLGFGAIAGGAVLVVAALRGEHPLETLLGWWHDDRAARRSPHLAPIPPGGRPLEFDTYHGAGSPLAPEVFGVRNPDLAPIPPGGRPLE